MKAASLEPEGVNSEPETQSPAIAGSYGQRAELTGILAQLVSVLYVPD